MKERRKDSKNRVLKEGESERKGGTYEYKWRDNKGGRHSVYAKTLEELRDKENDILKDILNGKRVVDKKLTINDFYDRWVQLKRGLKENTFQNYQYMYTQYVQKGFGYTKIHLLKKSDIRAFYIYLHDTLSVKVNTIDNIHTVLHQVLELAVDDGYMQSNPSDNALKELRKAHNAETEKRRALTISQQKIFENFLQTDKEYNHWQPIFTVMLYTGMRVGEICGLRWCDVDFDEGFISVNHTLVLLANRNKGYTKCEFIINTTKTAAGFRQIPMLPIVREALNQERKNQFEAGVACDCVVEGYTDFIFVNRFGKVQHQGTLNKALKRIIRDCNYAQIEKNGETLPPFSCHNLRHTFATRLCEANINIKAIQAMLGHADVSVTLDIYTDATKELKAKEAITLEEYFNSFNKDKVEKATESEEND